MPEAALQRNIINIQPIPETEFCPKIFVIGISINIKDEGQMEQKKWKKALMKYRNITFELISS